MDKNTKQRLINLGSDALADALIELASNSDEAENLVERMKSVKSTWRAVMLKRLCHGSNGFQMMIGSGRPKVMNYF